MSSKRWLKAEIRKWVQNDLITPSEGNAILAQYEEESHSYQDIFFIMASLSIGGGLLSLGASFWNGLTQGQHKQCRQKKRNHSGDKTLSLRESIPD